MTARKKDYEIDHLIFGKINKKKESLETREGERGKDGK